jgi:hypothetical protein
MASSDDSGYGVEDGEASRGTFTSHFELGDKTLDTLRHLANETVIRFELESGRRRHVRKSSMATAFGSSMRMSYFGMRSTAMSYPSRL